MIRPSFQILSPILLIFLFLAALACPASAVVFQFSYDDAGQLTRVEGSQGNATIFAYDPAGNLDYISLQGSGGSRSGSRETPSDSAGGLGGSLSGLDGDSPNRGEESYAGAAPDSEDYGGKYDFEKTRDQDALEFKPWFLKPILELLVITSTADLYTETLKEAPHAE